MLLTQIKTPLFKIPHRRFDSSNSRGSKCRKHSSLCVWSYHCSCWGWFHHCLPSFQHHLPQQEVSMLYKQHLPTNDYNFFLFIHVPNCCLIGLLSWPAQSSTTWLLLDQCYWLLVTQCTHSQHKAKLWQPYYAQWVCCCRQLNVYNCASLDLNFQISSVQSVGYDLCFVVAMVKTIRVLFIFKRSSPTKKVIVRMFNYTWLLFNREISTVFL